MMRTALLASALLCAAAAAPAAPDVHPKAQAVQEKARQTKARPESPPYRFAVIGHPFKQDGGEQRLKRALERSADLDAAFVVATGIKAEDEPCQDALYTRRRDLYDSVRRPLIVVPAASDWTGCVDGGGAPVAAQRMSRIRELFHGEQLSLGRRPMEVSRLSATARYRRFAENAYWEVGNVLYATINLPSNNNNYIADAGRNNEFEDRWVANRYWLKRVFTHAQRSRTDAVVLFSEANIRMLDQKRGLLARLRGAPTPSQDGFVQTRRLLTTLMQKYPGKVLLVDSGAVPAGSTPALAWRERIGQLSVGDRAVALEVAPGTDTLFTVLPLKDGGKAEGKPASKK